MARVEERVAHLEGQMNELSQGLAGVMDAIRHLEQRIDARFNSVDARFGAVDARFGAVDARFASVEMRFGSIEARFDAVDRRFDALDDKMSRQFVWLVGIVVTVLVALAGAVLSRG